MSELPDKATEDAASLLREKGWVVTPPADLKYGCFTDLFCCEPGTEPDGCVVDTNEHHLCIYAKGRTTKESCGHWKAWTPESLKAFWEAYK